MLEIVRWEPMRKIEEKDSVSEQIVEHWVDTMNGQT